MVEFPQQPADGVPLVGLAHLQIAQAIHADQRFIGYARFARSSLDRLVRSISRSRVLPVISMYCMAMSWKGNAGRRIAMPLAGPSYRDRRRACQMLRRKLAALPLGGERCLRANLIFADGVEAVVAVRRVPQRQTHPHALGEDGQLFRRIRVRLASRGTGLAPLAEVRSPKFPVGWLLTQILAQQSLLYSSAPKLIVADQGKRHVTEPADRVCAVSGGAVTKEMHRLSRATSRKYLAAGGPLSRKSEEKISCRRTSVITPFPRRSADGRQLHDHAFQELRQPVGIEQAPAP